MKLQTYFLRMGFSMFIIGGIGVFFASSLWAIFLSNPRLNGLIIALTFGGVAYAFYQLFRLKNDTEVLEDLKHGQWSFSSLQKTVFLESIISFINQKKSDLDPSFARGLADSLADRLDNERVFPRYLIGLLVFLGLLGTFWGLSQTISAITQLIQNMPSDVTESGNFFNLLKENLQNPLRGMGTAFSSSLFGLGGSLLFGFLELQVGHAYGRFLNEVDLYLMACSHHPSKHSASFAPLGFLQALLTKNVESIEQLTQVVERSEKQDRQTIQLLDKLITALALVNEQNKTQQNLMVKIAEGQINLQDHFSGISQGLDEESRKHIQNIERLLSYFLQTQRENKDEFLKKLREEIRLIAHTIANLGDQHRLVS